MKNKTQLDYISGLKGISCLFVMLGHFAGILKYIDQTIYDISFVQLFTRPPFKVLFLEGFWLQLFFLASGFLLALRKIESFSALIIKILRRFLRLGIPILFSCAIIYVILLCCGVHSAETTTLFTNEWYQRAYSSPSTILDVLLSPIQVLLFGICKFNSPYWVLKDMFLSSVLIYICLYIQNKASKRWLIYPIGYICLFVAACLSNVAAVCVFGTLLAQHRHLVQKVLQISKWLGMAGLLLLTLISILWPNSLTAILFFSTVILIAPFYIKINQTLSGRIPLFLSKISFGIYSFHWPILCSLGALILIAGWNIGVAYAFSLCIVSCALLTIILSYFYHTTAEKAADAIVSKTIGLLTRTWSRK